MSSSAGRNSTPLKKRGRKRSRLLRIKNENTVKALWEGENKSEN